MVIELWGDSIRVSQAKSAINEWIKDVHGPDTRRKEIWPKNPSLTDAEKRMKYRALERQLDAREFCQVPPNDVDFPCLVRQSNSYGELLDREKYRSRSAGFLPLAS